MTQPNVSMRGIAELIGHEGAVLEAYKDSVGVWTWGIGITSASGHNVDRYRHNPQTLERVLEVFLWALKRYERDVIETFKPKVLNEHQLAAAVSFHYNTGAIKRASWVKHFKAGRISKARQSFMAWSKPKEIIPRRRSERDLFFDGKWTGNRHITIWGVYKNGNVNWGNRKRVDAMPALQKAMADKIKPIPKPRAEPAKKPIQKPQERERIAPAPKPPQRKKRRLWPFILVCVIILAIGAWMATQ